MAEPLFMRYSFMLEFGELARNQILPKGKLMTFYKPDLGANPDDPFARDANGELARRSFWLDLSDRSLVLAMNNGVGVGLTASEKRAHLEDIGRSHIIDQVCVQEILPPETD